MVPAGIDERLERTEMALAAVAKHERFNHCCPTEIIDVVEWRLGLRAASS